MQVSWIDSEHLKDLLRQLQGAAPEPAAEPQAWETHTLPEAPVESALPSLAAEPAEAAPPEPVRREPEAVASPPVAAEVRDAPEVARIRDRLREVRERAEAAGLLKKAEPAPVAPEPAVSEPPHDESVNTASVVEDDAEPAARAEAIAAAEETGMGAEETEAEKEMEPVISNEEVGEVADAVSDDSLYFEVPLGSVLERLDAFAEWARRRIAPAELLLLDEHGDLLLGTEARAELVLSIMLAASAAKRSSLAGVWADAPRIARQPKPDGGELAILSCPTRLGIIHLAVEHPAQLPDSEADLLQQALLSAIEAAA